MAEYIYVHEDALFKVDDNLSDRAAAVIEPLAVVIHALHRAQFGFMETAAVMGAGPDRVL